MSHKNTLNVYDDGNIPDVDLPSGEDSDVKNSKEIASAGTTFRKNTSRENSSSLSTPTHFKPANSEKI